MPRFANCEIGIKIEDNVLEEYGTQIVGSSATSWIASESGKVSLSPPIVTIHFLYYEFEIVFRAEHYPSSLQLIIFVDGIELVNRGYDERRMGREIICNGVSIDARTVKPFVFSDIIFSGKSSMFCLHRARVNVASAPKFIIYDIMRLISASKKNSEKQTDEDAAFDPARSRKFGAIRVEILQVVFSESRDPTYRVPGMSNDPAQRRSRINGARGVCLGEQKAFRTKKMTSMPFDPLNPGPVAIFNYIYRPRAMLLAQGIIPTYVPKFVEEFSNASPVASRDEGRGEAIRRLKEQQERVQRELRELEDLRRLRERQAEIERELEQLEGYE
ncbi:hypothetical protein M0805_009022 [Coniferiporia weirii]|nr:hypothetical protein M0805_009022 [Coniferiporia weirii]